MSEQIPEAPEIPEEKFEAPPRLDSAVVDEILKKTQERGQGFEPESVEEWKTAAAIWFQSKIVPEAYLKLGADAGKAACFVTMQKATSAGFHYTDAFDVLWFLDGKLAWYGKAALALIRKSGLCEFWECTIEDRGDWTDPKDAPNEMRAIVRTRRVGDAKVQEFPFTVQQAKLAGLWNAKFNWKHYPEDMLKWKAIARAANQLYSDVLYGLAVMEDVREAWNRRALESAVEETQRQREGPGASSLFRRALGKSEEDSSPAVDEAVSVDGAEGTGVAPPGDEDTGKPGEEPAGEPAPPATQSPRDRPQARQSPPDAERSDSGPSASSDSATTAGESRESAPAPGSLATGSAAAPCKKHPNAPIPCPICNDAPDGELPLS